MTQEQIVDNLVLDLLDNKVPGTKDIILQHTTKSSRRLAMLHPLDNDRKLLEQYKNIIRNEQYCSHYAEDVVQILREYVQVADVEKKEHGEVMTPLTLVDEMLDKLPNDVWSNKDLKWLDPCNGVGTFPSLIVKKLMIGLKDVIVDDCERYRHIIENMIYVCEIQAKNMFLFHCAFDREDDHELNTYFGSFLDKDFDEHMLNVWGVEKFDIIVGNPPYNKPGTSNSGNQIWHKFVEKSIDVLIDGGFLCVVHPPNWRKPGSKNFNMISKHKIHYLEIHNNKDGVKVFGAQTRYDWYVLEKTPTDNIIKIKDELGGEYVLDLKIFPFIPNMYFNQFIPLLSNETDEKCEVIYDRNSYASEYIDTDKGRDWMSKNEGNGFIHPVVNNINKTKGVVCFYSNKNTNGHFNIPKVIISTSSAQMNFLDNDGNFGMGKDIFGIKIDNQIMGDEIITSLNSETFIKLCLALNYSSFRVEWQFFTYLKKDFYKILNNN